MKKKIILYVVGVMLLLAMLLFGTVKLMNARSFQLFGKITSHVKTNQKVVAITFDDGPTENTEHVLRLLDQYDAKATFFLVGNEIERNPDEARKIVEAGHQVGNHTFSHQRMVFKSSSFIKEEIEKTDALIQEAGYKGAIYFRPPYGKKLVGLPYYLHSHKRETITWNLEPDTYFKTVKDKMNYIKQNVEPGSIILFHPMYDKTENELKTIKEALQYLSNDGYKFVTVEEMLKLKE